MPKNLAASPEEIARLRSLYREIQDLQWKLTSGPAASTSITANMMAEYAFAKQFLRPILTNIIVPFFPDIKPGDETAMLIASIMVGTQTCMQLGGMTYGFIKLRKILVKYFPNSVYTTSQQIPRVITQLRQGDELSNKDLIGMKQQLTTSYQQLSSRANYPFLFILASFGISCISNWFLWPLLEDSDYASPYLATKNAFIFGGMVGPIAGWTLDAISNRYRNWNRANREDKARQQFQDHFSPRGKFTWQVAGNKSIQTKILYTSFHGKNKVKVQMTDCTVDIPAKRYFLELAKVLVQTELNFLLVTKDGIYIGLEDTLGLVMEKAQETLYQRLRTYHLQTQILNQLNAQYSIYATNWQNVEQDDNSIFFISTNHDTETLRSTLQAEYSNVEVINRPTGTTIAIKNPKLKAHVPTGGSSSSSAGTPKSYYAHFAAAEPTTIPRQRPSKSKKAEEPGPSAPKTMSKPKILVTFPRVNLQFNSATYIEATALMRPMNAAWLPDYCHFSYLDPRISIYLPGDLNLSQILGILRSGQTFPAGILKGKTGGVGICVAHEPYTNIHGQTFISDYKIKTKGYRLHGRLHDTATDKRRRVYIFDGVRKHGH